MARKTVAGAAGADPTLPDVTLVIDGKTWHLVYNYDAIARAERALNAAAAAATPKGVPFVPINLLRGFNLEEASAEQLRGLLYAALMTAHPKVTLKEVSTLIRMDTLTDIYGTIAACWMQSQPAKKTEEDADRPTEGLSET